MTSKMASENVESIFADCLNRDGYVKYSGWCHTKYPLP